MIMFNNQTSDGEMRPQIHLVSGMRLDLEHPDPVVININDIATALSNLCRFNGQLQKFYSVAEHSVFCAAVAQRLGAHRELVLACLMHDSAEAYLGDVIKPLKLQLDPVYQNFETVVESAIEIRFGINFELYKQDIKRIDQAVYRAECAAFGRPCGQEPLQLDLDIQCWSPDRAKREFLYAYSECVSSKLQSAL